MCLAIIKEMFDGTGKETGIGWKIFKKEDGKLQFPHAKDYTKVIPKVTIGKWLTSTEGKAKSAWGNTRERYETGFHMYLTRQGARDVKTSYYKGEEHVIRKVQWKGLTATGEQCGAKAAVAKKIMILKTRG